MAEISTLGYLCITASDLPQWQRFAVDVLGMQVSAHPEPGHLALRLDEVVQRILITEGPDDDLTAVGWQFNTAAELDDYVVALSARGIEVAVGSDALVKSRRVEQVYTATDPDGLRQEFYYGPVHAHGDRPFRSEVLRGGFVTGELGVGHFVSAATDYADTIGFYQDGLGLRVSDHIRALLKTPAGTLAFDGTFFHTVTGRHHSFATAQIPFPKRIHHFMVEVEDPNDVGMAYYRCLAAGVPIMMGLGHHPNDGMFSFYAVSPSGFAVEFGSGGVVVDADHWTVRSYSQLSDWGHASPAGH